MKDISVILVGNYLHLTYLAKLMEKQNKVSKATLSLKERILEIRKINSRVYRTVTGFGN